MSSTQAALNLSKCSNESEARKTRVSLTWLKLRLRNLSGGAAGRKNMSRPLTGLRESDSKINIMSLWLWLATVGLKSTKLKGQKVLYPKSIWRPLKNSPWFTICRKKLRSKRRNVSKKRKQKRKIKNAGNIIDTTHLTPVKRMWGGGDDLGLDELA